MVDGAVYDVAVNIGRRVAAGAALDMAFAERDLPLPSGRWSEGWHPDYAPLDYVATLGLHAAEFTPVSPTEILNRLEGELVGVSRISVFAVGYGPDGVHDVHRNQGLDGALALRPAGASAHLVLFHFASQTF